MTEIKFLLCTASRLLAWHFSRTLSENRWVTLMTWLFYCFLKRDLWLNLKYVEQVVSLVGVFLGCSHDFSKRKAEKIDETFIYSEQSPGAILVWPYSFHSSWCVLVMNGRFPSMGRCFATPLINSERSFKSFPCHTLVEGREDLTDFFSLREIFPAASLLPFVLTLGSHVTFPMHKSKHTGHPSKISFFLSCYTLKAWIRMGLRTECQWYVITVWSSNVGVGIASIWDKYA